MSYLVAFRRIHTKAITSYRKSSKCHLDHLDIAIIPVPSLLLLVMIFRIVSICGSAMRAEAWREQVQVYNLLITRQASILYSKVGSGNGCWSVCSFHRVSGQDILCPKFPAH